MVQISEIDSKHRGGLGYEHGERGREGEEEEDMHDSDYTDVEEGVEGEESEATVAITEAIKWRRLLSTWLVSPFSGLSRWSTKKVWTRLQHIGRVAGNIAWIFTTSMLLVGLPVLFAYDREKALQEQQLVGLPTPAPN